MATTDFEGMANVVMPALVQKSDVFVDWTFEYPGFVALRTDSGGMWAIGTVDGTWGANLYCCEESFCEGEQPHRNIDTGISEQSEDVDAIAAALYAEMSK